MDTLLKGWQEQLKIIKLIFGFFMALIVLTNCSSGGRGGSQTPHIVSIEVSPASFSPANLTHIGVLTKFVATAIYSDKSKKDVTNDAIWSSSNTGIATVDNNSNKGIVTPLVIGTTNIAAKMLGISGSYALNVIAGTLMSVQIAYY